MHRYQPPKHLRDAWDHIGGLSFPSKMPCPGYSIPAETCQVGSRLRDVPGSTCSDCYACKNCYQYPSTQRAMWRRYGTVTKANGSFVDGYMWREAFIAVLRDLRDRKGVHYFRWHDSGDIQSTYHLHLICEIAAALPDMRFWLPTREVRLVRQYLVEAGPFPSNLQVRISAPMRDKRGPRVSGCTSSEVHTTDRPVTGAAECDAYMRDGECGDCRACWSAAVPVVSYPAH